MSSKRVLFENSAPILKVASMPAAVAFYCQGLGFTNADWGSDDFTCVTRDAAAIYLCEGSQGGGETWVWVGIADVAAYEQEITARGVTIGAGPANLPWALEMHVRDLDGHVLRFGSEPLPVGGEDEAAEFAPWPGEQPAAQGWRPPAAT